MKRDLTIVKMEATNNPWGRVFITATNYADDTITISVGNNEEGFALNDTVTVEITKASYR